MFADKSGNARDKRKPSDLGQEKQNLAEQFKSEQAQSTSEREPYHNTHQDSNIDLSGHQPISSREITRSGKHIVDSTEQGASALGIDETKIYNVMHKGNLSRGEAINLLKEHNNNDDEVISSLHK
ncbi:hypothetical protein ABK040_003340 [Willaertia magna]